MKEVKKNIELLRNRLRHWEYLYYVEEKPAISDDQYDQYLEMLRILEKQHPDLIVEHSPTQRVGGLVKSCFRSIHHIVPMLSLDNVFDEGSLLGFDQKIRDRLGYSDDQKIVYCCELKIDGVGVSLIYDQGVLIRAATRGDGVMGEDVTENVRTVRSIPLYLKQDKSFPAFLEIRGEVFMSNSSFLKLNQSFIENGSKIFSNPRNAASGSLRQINSYVTSKRHLDFFCYHMASMITHGDESLVFDSHWEQLQQCYRWGIPVVKDYARICIGINEVVLYFKEIQKIRSELQFNIDGIVVKIDSIFLQKKLGVSFRAPRWAVSYKFPSKKVISKICNIQFHVSRTGVLIPVASLIPVSVSGITIQSATLHNIGFIRRLGLMLGDSVIVERAGDVIPKITKVVLSDRVFNDVRQIVYPNNCPACKSLLSRITVKKSFVLRCNSGVYCCAQRKALLKHFVSRKAMNIIGMGDKIIERLIKVDLLCTPVDFFKLNIKNLIGVEGIQERLARRLMHSIEVSKKTTLVRFIYALGIPNVGEVSAAILSEKYSNIRCLMDADITSLLNVKNIGFIVAYDIFNFFRNEHSLRMINELLNHKIIIK